MKHFKKTTATRITAALLSFAMLFGLTACGSGGGKSTGGSAPATSDAKSSSTGTATESGMAESGTGRAGQADSLTLEDGEAKLICRKDTFISLLYHGPYKEIGASFTDAKGESLKAFTLYEHLSDGWTVIASQEFPADYTGEVMISVTDYSAQKISDDQYPKKLYPLTETLSKDEAKAAGLGVVEDHICVVIAGHQLRYGNESITGNLYFSFLDEYRDRKLETIDGLMDRLTWYAEDGTPLDQCLPGYTLECKPSGTKIAFTFTNKNSDKEQNKEMCDKFRKLKPYAIYTAKDGATQKFPFFQEKDQ